MKSISISSTSLPPAFGSEVNSISRKETDPLFAKARKILKLYNQAIGLTARILDRTGITVNEGEIKNQTKLCDFCKKNHRNASKLQDGNNWPCAKIHADALIESRRTNGVLIYSCPAGFTHWTSPLYRNGRYAGSLAAGQVFSVGPKAKMEEFHAFCKDSIAPGNCQKALDEVPKKNHEEVQAMAKLLGVCAKRISEKGTDNSEAIRSIAISIGQKKDQIKTVMPPEKEDRSFSREADPEYSLEKERLLLAAFRRGDNETGRKLLGELIKCFITAIPGNIDILRFKAIELIVLLSRAAAHNGSGGTTPESEVLLEANNRYIKRIQESRTAEELIENLQLIAERMSGRIFSFQGIRHASVLRRAERYIWENYTRKISLDEIAKASGLSAPYFSTIFKEEMGENLSTYLNRLRIERAVTLLTETRKTLNEIAALCGFEDQSWFSKIFKSFAGISPGKFREHGGRLASQGNGAG